MSETHETQCKWTVIYVCRRCSSGLRCKGPWYQMKRRTKRYLALTWKQPKSDSAEKTRSLTRSSTAVKSRRNTGWDQLYHHIFHPPGSCQVHVAPPSIKWFREAFDSLCSAPGVQIKVILKELRAMGNRKTLWPCGWCSHRFRQIENNWDTCAGRVASSSRHQCSRLGLWLITVVLSIGQAFKGFLSGKIILLAPFQWRVLSC